MTVTHGARTEAKVRPTATVQKRRLLRQIGLRASDLDGIGQGYLDAWARAQSKVELMDAWSATHGWLDTEGRPPGFVDVYFAACNTARLSLSKLSDHLKHGGRRRLNADPLDAYRSPTAEIDSYRDASGGKS